MSTGTEELCSCREPIATCPHGVPVPFATYEEKYAHYKGKPAREAVIAHAREAAREAGAMLDRLRIAQAAHDVGEVAEDFGAELPIRQQLEQLADAVSTFAPMARFVPGLAAIPGATIALAVMGEAARLLLRGLRGR